MVVQYYNSGDGTQWYNLNKINFVSGTSTEMIAFSDRWKWIRISIVGFIYTLGCRCRRMEDSISISALGLDGSGDPDSAYRCGLVYLRPPQQKP